MGSHHALVTGAEEIPGSSGGKRPGSDRPDPTSTSQTRADLVPPLRMLITPKGLEQGAGQCLGCRGCGAVQPGQSGHSLGLQSAASAVSPSPAPAERPVHSNKLLLGCRHWLTQQLLVPGTSPGLLTPALKDVPEDSPAARARILSPLALSGTPQRLLPLGHVLSPQPHLPQDPPHAGSGSG